MKQIYYLNKYIIEINILFKQIYYLNKYIIEINIIYGKMTYFSQSPNNKRKNEVNICNNKQQLLTKESLYINKYFDRIVNKILPVKKSIIESNEFKLFNLQLEEL